MVWHQPKYNSVLHLTERYHLYTHKKYNWLQKKMWKFFFNVEVEEWE